MGKVLNIVAIVQARMSSSRLPEKVMRQISGESMIGLLLKRLSKSEEIHQIIVATSVNERDTKLADYIAGMGFYCYRGSEADVLGRYLDAAKEVNADIIVRITGDCPLVDPELVDLVIKSYLAADYDYFSNINPPSFPDGLDVEVFSIGALEQAALATSDKGDREHVTMYFRRTDIFRKGNLNAERDYSSHRWTVDESSDLEVVNAIFNYFKPNIYFNWEQVITLHQKCPQLFLPNSQISRNKGSEMSNGQKLWQRAKEVIPGGNMLLSKRPEMFLPAFWPTYFSKAKGCKVWDIDGNEYTDVSLMGVGTNILGYAHQDIDAAVLSAISLGNMSTLNCPEEVQLAERLIDMHPWADMVRFARTGGEANAIAIRLARAASGRDKVAFCGYHGWHDWYLSANLAGTNNLAGQLLPGLEPNGVPGNLSETVFPFNYNAFDELENLVSVHEIGVIKMEVVRNKGPEKGFLEKVRQLATEKNIVLIFDECTSGFRQAFGGVHKLYGVEPDMAVFGKALGNGYAITAVIGRRNIMEAAQSTFVSSTFWTERIGPVAALKTLNVMEQEKSWEYISQVGESVFERWKLLADRHHLSIDCVGLSALPGFSFAGKNSLAYKTYVTQELLKKNFLAGTSIYLSTSHTPEILDAYFDELDHVFAVIRQCEDGRDIFELLQGPVCHSGFKRLN
jgi:glutamate-1-semialdehyde 2,1-aminomutase